jgi:hypothetical protein
MMVARAASMPTPYENILRTVESLSKAEQLRLISELGGRLGSGAADKSVLELQGLGKEIWHGIDAQEYVQRERGSWNG